MPIGCPTIPRRLHFDDSVRQWLANDKLNQFLPEQHVAQVSMIFKSYKADFVAGYGSVEQFLAK
jgi:hypothetical protein